MVSLVAATTQGSRSFTWVSLPERHPDVCPGGALKAGSYRNSGGGTDPRGSGCCQGTHKAVRVQRFESITSQCPCCEHPLLLTELSRASRVCALPGVSQLPLPARGSIRNENKSLGAIPVASTEPQLGAEQQAVWQGSSLLSGQRAGCISDGIYAEKRVLRVFIVSIGIFGAACPLHCQLPLE